LLQGLGADSRGGVKTPHTPTLPKQIVFVTVGLVLPCSDVRASGEGWSGFGRVGRRDGHPCRPPLYLHCPQIV